MARWAVPTDASGTEPMTSSVAGSITATACPPPSATKTRRESGETTTPTGFDARSSGIVATTAWRPTSTTLTVAAISFVTYALRPSGAKATSRGRTSTRKLATTRSARVSITDTVLLVSAAT